VKPGDFYLGVVNLLGVVAPGAVFLLLRNFQPNEWWGHNYAIPDWLIFGGVAYVLGQLLLAATEIFNETVPWFTWGLFRKLHHDVDTFRSAASEWLALAKNDSNQSKFHTALSYLRLKSPAAAAEVDHHMADYKLLRNLVLVLAVDGAIRVFVEHRYGPAGIELGLLLVCVLAFVRMYYWSELLAFQYVCLMFRDTSPAQPKEDSP
jgi:hypothetical protein